MNSSFTPMTAAGLAALQGVPTGYGIVVAIPALINH
jgi:hypothetical protein